MSVIATYPTRRVKPTTVDLSKDAFTLGEMAKVFGWSRWTARRVFLAEPGITVLHRPETLHKQGRRLVTIPRAVFLRVKARLEALLI
jgi:hypothetical protein